MKLIEAAQADTPAAKPKRYLTACPRCNGIGRYDRGRCFQCHGACIVARRRKPSGPSFTVAVNHNGKRTIYELFTDSQQDANTLIVRYFANRGIDLNQRAKVASTRP